MEIIRYIAALILIVYLPIEGIASFGKITFCGWKRLLIFFIVGMAITTLTDYIFSLVSLRNLAIPVLILFAAIGVHRFSSWKKYISTDWYGPHVILLFFALLYSLSVTSSGWVTANGLALRGINTYDSVWNIALINELKESILPQHPAISGIPLRGYHVFYNLWVSTISRFTNIDASALHFHYVSIFLSIGLVYSCYFVGFLLSKNYRAALWSTFFALFGGSFAYLIPLFFRVHASMDDAFGITQPASLLVSPSFVSSLVILLVTFILIAEYARRPNAILGIFLMVMSGIVIGFKVYAGIIILPILVFFTLLALVHRRYDWLRVVFGSGVIALLVFVPFNASYGFLRYQPMWPPHRVMQGVFDFTHWELKRQTLEQFGSTLGLFRLEVIALSVFLFGNLGTRILGVLGMRRLSFSHISILHWVLWLAIGISFLLPLNFIQPIGAFNMIQFFWYFLVFTGILAGIGIYEFLRHISSPYRYIIAFFVILFTLPSAFEKLHGYSPLSTPHIGIPTSEYVMYAQMKSLGKYEDVVLFIPNLSNYSEKDLRDWFWRSSPPKITAFGYKRTFLINEGVQFPYEEWIYPRIRRLEAIMTPQGKANVSDAELFLAGASLQELVNSYRIRFILTEVDDIWFDSLSFVKEVVRSDGLVLYEVLSL